ncbi:MAG: 16S rRNA (guanine(527)-N(7))-methyltransferase RsmG [Clostridiales bacterium]|nr:16S rRNA (guanine(527)-N(7))-methyltransferase RsmG [Clostridiales bacterium]
MREILTEGLSQMGITPPGGAVEQLERYAQMLTEKNQVMNLTAITTTEGIARLHFLDSAAVLAYGAAVSRKDGGARWLAGKSVIDVGTGAGFPGVVIRILEPSVELTLLDSLGKRVDWLRESCEALSLSQVRCLHARAEEQALLPGFRDSFDVAVSRAVASLPLLCELCLPYVKPGGVFLALKSVDSDAEIAAAASAIKRLGGELLPPLDYPIPGGEVSHRLTAIRKVSHTPKGLPRKWSRIKKEPL